MRVVKRGRSLSPCLIALLWVSIQLCVAIRSEADDLVAQNYQQAASRPGTTTQVLGNPIAIESSEATASVAAVQLTTSDGQRHAGARLSLESPHQTEDLYLAASDVTQIRKEFASFES